METVCNRCRPEVTTADTLWCPLHRPPHRIPFLHWLTSPLIQHPGRSDIPDVTVESRDRLSLDIIPHHHEQVASLTWLEQSRWRIVAEILRFTIWVKSRRPPLDSQACPRATLCEYVHTLVRALSAHPLPHRRVTRPTTPRTWVKLLSLGIRKLAGAEHWREVKALLTGYAALAPAPSTGTLRGVSDRWMAARDAVQDRFKRAPSRRLAALWLSLELGRQGLRPKPAIRGCMGMSQRSLYQPTGVSSALVWRVRVSLDKDNKVGGVPAPRVRYITKSPIVDQVMEFLPFNDYLEVKEARKRILAVFGVSQVYSARRDAAEAAEASGLDVGALLNHRPGSRHTPGYAATATPTSLCLALISQQ